MYYTGEDSIEMSCMHNTGCEMHCLVCIMQVMKCFVLSAYYKSCTALPCMLIKCENTIVLHDIGLKCIALSAYYREENIALSA